VDNSIKNLALAVHVLFTLYPIALQLNYCWLCHSTKNVHNYWLCAPLHFSAQEKWFGHEPTC